MEPGGGRGPCPTVHAEAAGTGDTCTTTQLLSGTGLARHATWAAQPPHSRVDQAGDEVEAHQAHHAGSHQAGLVVAGLPLSLRGGRGG